MEELASPLREYSDREIRYILCKQGVSIHLYDNLFNQYLLLIGYMKKLY